MSEDNYMTPLVSILQELRSKGYECDFRLIDGKMHCQNSSENFNPDELTIEKVYRFEGDSNPDDMAVLYGIKTNNGKKGVIIDAYGTYDNDELGDFLRFVKVKD